MRRLLLLIAGLIVYGSLFPWSFDFARGHGASPFYLLLHARWPISNKFALRDAAINILLYIPLGLAASLALLRRHSRVLAAAAAILLGLALSASLEMLQIYIPTRTCSLADLLTNGIGAAVGAAIGLIFRPQLEGVSRKKFGPRSASAAVLFICWMGYQLFPLFPILSRTRIRVGLIMMSHLSSVSAIEVWAHAAEWFAAGLVLEALFGRMQTWWLAAAMLTLPLRLVIATRNLELHEVLGAALALLLWTAIPDRSRSRCGACFLAVAIVLRELAPFHFLSAANSFSWVPFKASFMGDREAAAIVLCRKAFEYGATVWLVRPAANGYWPAGIALAAALGAMEAAQRYMPGRTPEITDSVLAILLTFVLWKLDRLSRNSLR